MTTQMLDMKPNTARRMFADRFNNVEDLKLAIAKIELVSNQTPDVIDVFGEIELEAECLSDGSVVYNAFLTNKEENLPAIRCRLVTNRSQNGQKVPISTK